MSRALALGLTVALFAAEARAQTAPGPDPATPASPDKSGYSLVKPVPTDQLRGLCTDRPTKSTGPCTVDAGHWQLESDIYNVTFQRGGGVATTLEMFTNPTLKLGLTNTLDVEANIAPDERLTIKDHGVTTRTDGIGDLYLRAKWNLLGADSGDVAVALSPYIKAPTASRALGDGFVEGGTIAAVQFNLTGGWQLLFDPEADVLHNQSGDGGHLNAAGLVSLSHPVSKTVTLSAELWADQDFEPHAPTTQVSADFGVAWIPESRPNLQLDTGINVGLNNATPGLQAYVGLSHRY